jgi:hypothetical protein
VTQPGNSSDSEVEITTSDDAFVVQRQGTELRVGRNSNGTILWQDETVPVAELPDDARQALDARDLDAAPLKTALDAIVQAFATRGG